MNKIIKYSLFNSIGTTAYITLIATLFHYLSNSPLKTENSILIPIFMLLVFVFSATITGTLVLGRPIIWYFNKKKKEAILLFIYTLCFLLLFTIVDFILFTQILS